MAANKYVKLNTTTGRLEQQSATDVSTGASDAGKIVALGNDGLISPTMVSAAGSTSAISIIAHETLVAGDFVNLLYTAVQKRARKANATDTTLPAQGYVLDAISATASGLVYFDGLNTQVPQGTFTTADIGKRVFQSTTAGTVTLTPPVTTGNLLQCLGVIVGVAGSLVTIDVEITDGIVV